MNKLTVTIGVPAHNEAKNISRLLDSIKQQRLDSCVLERVIIACDGCTDDTSQIAKNYSTSYSLVEVWDDGKRLGKIGRLNEFYQKINTDVFIMFDGDSILSNNLVVDKLVRSFSNESVGLVGGLEKPLKPQGLVEKIAVTWTEVWLNTRKDLNGGQVVHNHAGCVSAINRKLYRDIIIPETVAAEDEFLFFACIKKGLEFRFAQDAVVNYRCPSSLNEYLMQSARFISSKDNIAEYFGHWVLPYYDVPVRNKLFGIVATFIRKPILTVMAVLLQIYLKFELRKYVEDYSKGIWTTIKTSK